MQSARRPMGEWGAVVISASSAPICLHFSALIGFEKIIWQIWIFCQFVLRWKNARSFAPEFSEKMVITFREIQPKKFLRFFRIVRNV